jgi:hypothetical protein
MISAVQLGGHPRRRDTRHPAGWTLVELNASTSAYALYGRIVDTSEGGLGLIVAERPPVGAHVRVARADGRTGISAWEGRIARVAYARPLGDGRWRAGLSFPPPAPSRVQLWASRFLLAFLLATLVWPTLSASPLAAVLPGGYAIIVIALAAGVELQHVRMERRHTHELDAWLSPAHQPSDETRSTVATHATPSVPRPSTPARAPVFAS